MEPLKFGRMVGGEPPFATASKCVSLSMQTEKDGFDSIWMPDHLVDIDGSLADPWSTLGYVSAVTHRLSLYTSVTDYQRSIRRNSPRSSQHLTSLAGVE